MLKKYILRKQRRRSSLDENAITLKNGAGDKNSEREGFIKTNTEQVEEYDDLSFIVDYIGSDYVSEAQSVPLLMETLKRIKKQHTKTIRVDVVLNSGVLKVMDIEQGALLITAPLYAIALCAQEQLRGFETTFALNITLRRIHMCHVFQAGSMLEAASIVRSIALSFRSVAKDLKEKRYDSAVIDRVRSDSESSTSKYRVRVDSDASKEFDAIARRHFSRVGGLPTLQSVENIQNEANGKVNTNAISVSVLLHRTSSSCSNENVSERMLQNEDTQSGLVSTADPDQTNEKFFVADLTDLFSKGAEAVERGDKETLLKCFEDGLSLDTVDKNHRSLLHYSVLKNQADITELLLERGADVNKEGLKDQTALHLAAAEGNRAITKILLANGANVRAKDCHFRTPLHYCAGCLQSLEVSYVLVEHGARIEDNDIEGVRPVDLHLELREMQNRLIQSACEAFAAADISRSRSNSAGSSSHSGSFISSAKSPGPIRHSHTKLLRSGSLRLKASPSLHSIQDVADNESPNSEFRIPEILDKLPTLHPDAERHKDASELQPCQNTTYTHDSNTSVEIGLSETTSHKEVGITNEPVLSEQVLDDESSQNQLMVDLKISHQNRANVSGSLSRLFKKDAATDALSVLVTLSGNAECQSNILANLCLPKASSQLVSLAHSVHSRNLNLQQTSKLLSNLFNVSGPTGRQKCVSAGLLKTVVDLLDAAEPVQGTCLSILNELLQTEHERDYSGTITGIPIEPLLTIIKSIDSSPSEVEQISREKTKIRLTQSIDSGYPGSPFMERSTSTKKKRDESECLILKSYSWGRNAKGYLKGDPVITSENIGRGRSESFSNTSDTTHESSLSAGRGNNRNSDTEARETNATNSVLRHRRCSRGSNSSVEGQTNFLKPSKTGVVARHVAMKMLAASSRNDKLQEQLAKPRILKLLVECLDDFDEEIILQATATLANIAMNVETHEQLSKKNIDENLMRLLKNPNSKIKFQAARGLIYLGHDVDQVYIFYSFPEEDSHQSVIYVEDDGRAYIKGTTVENLVFILTKDIHMLWAGPPTQTTSSDKTTSARSGSSKYRTRVVTSEVQIINFILSTFQTFVHPIIFMRLLMHRFREPTAYKVFREIECGGTALHMEHYAPLPILHARIMRVWIGWLDNCPINFLSFPCLLTELSRLIAPMRSIDGPYTPCANKLESLMLKVGEISDHVSIYRSQSDNHHNVLFEQCYKAIKEAKLPCSEEDFIYLAGLQLYIEDMKRYGQGFADYVSLTECLENINSTRLKGSIGGAVSLTKHQIKKIRSHYESLYTKQPTDRNSKHNYVDCCQGMDGYGCTFFKTKQRIPSTRSRKKVYLPRFLGISSKRIVVLDERSKICVDRFNLKELQRWKPIEENLILKMIFKVKCSEIALEFQLENRVGLKEVSNHLLTCTMEISLQGYNIDTDPWSRLAEQCGTWGNMALQVHLLKRKDTEDVSVTNTIRERTTTTWESTKQELNDVSENYSQSAPVTQDTGWNTSEVSKRFLYNFKGRLRNRGDTVLSVSTTPSEVGTPPKDISYVPELSSSPQNNTEPSCSKFQRGLFTVTTSTEKTPMFDEGTGDKIGDTQSHDFSTQSTGGKILTCNCPPDADLPNLNLRDFSAFELLEHPRELARQITLIDHELFCKITSLDVLLKISLGLIHKHQNNSSKLSVEKVAERFNKMSNWIVYSIVSERNIHRRAKMFKNFIETAKQCLELRNYNAVMAIVVASLGSAHVRRLAATKELVTPEYLSCLSKMEGLMDSKSNYKKYREALRTSPTPTVPYFGIYLKDLTFISDGNPDYMKGGVINLSKRRQVFLLLEEIRRFQRKRYNFQEVGEIKEYLMNKTLVSEDQLNQMSKEHEPTISPRLIATTIPDGSNR